MEVGRGGVLQELQRCAVGRAGACRGVRPARWFGGRKEELPKSVLGESLCRAEEVPGGLGRVLAAERAIHLERRCRSLRRTVAGFGRNPQPAFPGLWLVATTVGLAFRTQPFRTESDHVAGLRSHKEDEQQIGNRSFHARLPQGYPNSPTLHLQSRAVSTQYQAPRAYCKIRRGAGHFAGTGDVLPLSMSGVTW